MARRFDECERDYHCASCGARSGSYCRRRDGQIAAQPHRPRIDQWYAAGVTSGRIREFRLSIN